MSSRKKTVLIIDDEPEGIVPTKDALEERYTVILERSPKAAIEFLSRDNAHIDLIILDLLMPPIERNVAAASDIPDLRYTGVKLYRQIRDVMHKSDIPIIVFSVVNDALVKREITDYESEKYQRDIFVFTKPTIPNEILEAVDEEIGD